MQIEILYQPSYSLARILLKENEAIRTETGSMVGFKKVEVETRVQGGLFRSLARSAFTGESFFINTYRALEDRAEVLLAPTMPGDIHRLDLKNETFLVQSGSFLASAEQIEADPKWSGARTFFSGEGLIMLRCSGEGVLLLSSYGAIHSIELAEGEKFTVDTGHLVAFSEKIGFQVRMAGGFKSALLGGEGLVVELSGPGKVLIQTRSEGAFLDWLLPKIPTPKAKGD